MQKARVFRKDGGGDTVVEKFGDVVTADHIVTVHPDNISVDGDADAVVIRDRATRWTEVAPTAMKSQPEATLALRIFAGPTAEVKEFYSDNADELVNAAKELGWLTRQSSVGRPQPNGRAERTARAVLEGARAFLLQSGLHK